MGIGRQSANLKRIMTNDKSHWTSKGIAALLGSVDRSLSAGTLGEFYNQLWNLFYSDKKIDSPGRLEDPVEQAIWQVHELGQRAREKDEEALAKLILINAAASLQLQGVATQLPDHLRKFTERCNAWLGPVSGVPSIDGSVAETMDKVGLGGGPTEQKRKRTEFRSKPTGFAFLLLTYMTLIRFGFLTNRDQDWQSRCCALPPLDERAVPQWWALGREELERSFPTLHIILSRGRALAHQLPKDSALQRVEQAFNKLWKWFSFVSAYSLATSLLTRFKKNHVR